MIRQFLAFDHRALVDFVRYNVGALLPSELEMYARGPEWRPSTHMARAELARRWRMEREP